MRALVIGFGKMGMLHAATLNSLEPIQEVVLAENTSLIREGVRTFNSSIKTYKNYHEALEKEKIDLAVVCTPTHTHLEILKDLIQKGIPTFVEKPLAASFEEVLKIKQILEESPNPNLKIMVGYCLRFVPTFVKAKEVLDKKEIGEILNFEATMFSSDVEEAHEGWRFQKKNQGGGVLLDLGGHLVDLVRFLFGKPEKIKGETKKIYSKNVEDQVTARFDYKNFFGSLDVCWSKPGVRKAEVEIRVNGTKGTLIVSNDFIKSPSYSADLSELAESVPFDLAGFFYTKQWLEFLECIQKDKLNRNNVNESLDDHEILDAIRNSA